MLYMHVIFKVKKCYVCCLTLKCIYLKDECPVDALRACVLIYLPYI